MPEVRRFQGTWCGAIWDGVWGPSQPVRFNCNRKHSFLVDSAAARDQLILSRGAFTRLMALANFRQVGKVEISPGIVTDIKLNQPIDLLLKVFLTPYGCVLPMKEITLNKDTIRIVSSALPAKPVPSTVTLAWQVYGVRDIDTLPTWEIHFCGAVAQLYAGAYKSALLDYAATFEVFLEEILNERLSKLFGETMADFCLRRVHRVEDRGRDLLKLAGAASLTARNDVYQPWDEHVRDLRNRLAHGERIAIDLEAAERAHDATYQAIRWVQDQIAASTAPQP